MNNFLLFFFSVNMYAVYEQGVNYIQNKIPLTQYTSTKIQLKSEYDRRQRTAQEPILASKYILILIQRFIVFNYIDCTCSVNK